MKLARVMVVDSRDFYGGAGIHFPPIGAVGTVVSFLDMDDEFDVLFDDYPYPCPLGKDYSWVTHRRMVVFIDDDRPGVCQNLDMTVPMVNSRPSCQRNRINQQHLIGNG